MYTQCPKCHTIFAITAEQLAARQGRVRCGRCQEVFHGDQYCFDTLPVEVSANNDDNTGKAAPVFPEVERTRDDSGLQADSRIPTITDLSWMEARLTRRTHRGWWLGGSFLMLLIMAAQFLYIFRIELAQDAQARAWLVRACEPLRCVVPTPQDVNQIELNADIKPHPQFDKALLIEATLVNHARFVQPYPALELSFTDKQGVTIARRTFAPREYIDDNVQLTTGLAPLVSVDTVLEITQPANDAVGYEIHLASTH